LLIPILPKRNIAKTVTSEKANAKNASNPEANAELVPVDATSPCHMERPINVESQLKHAVWASEILSDEIFEM